MSYSPDQIARALSSLQDEKLRSQERRGVLVLRKMTFVGGLFALGSLELPRGITLDIVLYFVPVAAIAFDLYILGENFGIKRFGAFTTHEFNDEPEAAWERWVHTNRDPFSAYAHPVVTLLTLITCSVVLEPIVGLTPLTILWFAGVAGATLFLFIHSRSLTRRVFRAP